MRPPLMLILFGLFVLILFGLAAIAFGVHEYYDLAADATRKHSLRITLEYDKWAVLFFSCLFGTACLAYAGVARTVIGLDHKTGQD